MHVAILGLDREGISAALALHARDRRIQCSGWDGDDGRLAEAEHFKAFQLISKKITPVLKDADVIFITLSSEDFKEVLSEIKDHIRADALLIYLSASHVLPTLWAQEQLGGNCRFVCMLPAYRPTHMDESELDVEKPDADLFRDGSIFISVPPRAEAWVLEGVADFCLLLGGMPVFAEAVEVEGLAAIGLHLPLLSSAALMAAAGRRPGWKDSRKLAGRALAQSSAPLAELPAEETARSLILNRENVLRTLADLKAVLSEMENILQKEDTDALQGFLEESAEMRKRWLEGRAPQPEAREPRGPSLEKQALERFLKLGK